MRKLVLAAAIGFLPAGSAMAACEDNLAFLAPEEASRICGLEAGLPFTVGERSLGSDFIYFLAKKATFKGDVKMKQGQAFQANGEPYSKQDEAQKVVERIARLQGCTVSELDFRPGVSLSFALAC
jgi:hypothetical protein